MIVGQISAQLLLEEIRPAQLKVGQPWILPNVQIYRNPLTGSMIVAGGMGIQEELLDTVFPTLYPHKETWERMKELATEGNNNEELSKLLNENYEKRIMMVGEAFSIRDQMVCNQQDLKEIDEYINVYNTDESLKEMELEDEGAARMMQASGVLGNLDRIREI